MKGVTRADGTGGTTNYLRQIAVPILPLSEAINLYGQLPDTQLYAGIVDFENPGDSCQVCRIEYYLLIIKIINSR